MSMLFDISPTEESPRRPSRKKAEPEKPEKIASFAPARDHRFVPAPKPLGRIDHTYRCIDASCQAECSDILVEDRGQWFIECCFCGTKQWVPVIAAAAEEEREPEGSVFRLPHGVRDAFVGMTLDEVSSAGGDWYIKWAAEKCRNAEVRDACKTYLDLLLTDKYTSAAAKEC